MSVMKDNSISFCSSVSPVSATILLFLVELEMSAEALQDYGILVGKVTNVPSVK